MCECRLSLWGIGAVVVVLGAWEIVAVAGFSGSCRGALPSRGRYV